MPRGAAAPVGTERIAPNKYQYVKTEDRGWVLKHWVVWEQTNGRQVDNKVEQIRFKDGNRTNLDPSNLICVPKGKVQLRAKLGRLYAQRDDILAQIAFYEKQLKQES